MSVPDSGYFDLVLAGYSSMDGSMSIKLWSAKNKRHFTGVTQGTATSTSVTARFTDVPLDSYVLEVLVANKGYAYLANSIATINVKTMATAPASETNKKVSSLVGGTVVINGKGFDTAILSNNEVTVCGYPCAVTAATYSALTCSHQGIVTQEVDNTFRNEDPKVIKPKAIQTSRDYNVNNLLDGKFEDSYKGTTNDVVFDFGENMQANLSQVRLFPDMKMDIKRLNGTVMECSNDNTTFTPIMAMTMDSTRPGWNEWTSGNPADNKQCRYVRMNFNKEVVQSRYVAEV